MIPFIRLFLFSFGFIGISPVHAQSSDFLLLKKKDKTIQSYYPGSNIEFTTVNNIYRNGVITILHNDSIFIKEFLIRQLPTTLGTYLKMPPTSHHRKQRRLRHACPIL